MWPLAIVFLLIPSEKTCSWAACSIGICFFSDSCYFSQGFKERLLQVVALPTGAGAPPRAPSLPYTEGTA